MKKDVFRYVRSCLTCGEQDIPGRAQMGLMVTEKNVQLLWQVIAIDPLPLSMQGHTNIPVVSDWFSKYTLLFPLKKATAWQVGGKSGRKGYFSCLWSTPVYYI